MIVAERKQPLFQRDNADVMKEILQCHGGDSFRIYIQYTAAVIEDIFQRSVDAIFLQSMYVLNISMLCELEDSIICLAPRKVYIVCEGVTTQNCHQLLAVIRVTPLLFVRVLPLGTGSYSKHCLFSILITSAM